MKTIAARLPVYDAADNLIGMSDEPTVFPLRRAFLCSGTDLAEYNDLPFDVIEVVDQPDENHDLEVLPMARISFGLGREAEAFLDEITE